MIEGAEITPLNNVAGLSSAGPMLCYKGTKDSVPEYLLQTPFHCFMCHLETETSCSFHTFSVLAPEPGITCVLWRLYLEFVASGEPLGTPRCCMTCVLSSVWQTH